MTDSYIDGPLGYLYSTLPIVYGLSSGRVGLRVRGGFPTVPSHPYDRIENFLATDPRDRYSICL